MYAFKTRWFNKWARKKGIGDDALKEALVRIQAGLGIVALGGELFKMRIGREGGGRSGGYRTIVVYRESQKALFIYGFEKSDRENIDVKTLDDYKKYARDFLGFQRQEMDRLVAAGALIPLEVL